jgi:hypothetical protein
MWRGGETTFNNDQFDGTSGQSWSSQEMNILLRTKS